MVRTRSGRISELPPRSNADEDRPSTERHTRSKKSEKLHNLEVAARARRSSLADGGKKNKNPSFLHGLSCNTIDPLSLPDPPSPKNTADLKKRRRECIPNPSRERRHSSPFPCPEFASSSVNVNVSSQRLKSRDARNRGESENEKQCINSNLFLQQSPQKVQTKEQSASSKRRRSSKLKEEDDKKLNENLFTCSNESPLPDITNLASPQRKKKRKTRKSYVLPSEGSPQSAFIQNDMNKENFPTADLSKRSYTSNDFENPTSSILRDKTKVNWLVREYCSLPLSERATSAQAGDIQRLTNYRVCSSFERKNKAKALRVNSETKGSREHLSECAGNVNENHSDGFLQWTSSPSEKDRIEESSHSIDVLVKQKQELIRAMGPVVDLMESSKKGEVAKLEGLTNCRVVKKEKKRRGPSFRYVCIASGEEVQAKDYKIRYMHAVERDKELKKRKKRKNAANDLKSPNHVSKHRRSGSMGSSNTSTSQAAIVYARRQSSTIELEKTSTVTEKLVFNSAELGSPGSNYSVTSRRRTFSSCSTEESNNKRSRSSLTRKRSVTTAEVEDTVEMPSRHYTASDPQIAEAEERLWCTIDRALHQYSQEVISIKAARAKSK